MVDPKTLIDLLRQTPAIGLMAVIIVALLKEWVVTTGYVQRVIAIYETRITTYEQLLKEQKEAYERRLDQQREDLEEFKQIVLNNTNVIDKVTDVARRR